MKVLLVGGLNLGETLWTINRGLEKCGCDIKYIPMYYIPTPGSNKEERPDLYADIRQWADGADMLLWWQVKNLKHPEFLEEMSIEYPLLRLVSWSVDDPQVLDSCGSEAIKWFDYGATCCKGSFKWYEDNCVEPIFVASVCDSERHGNAKFNPEYACDISFASTNIYPTEKYPTVPVSRKQVIITVADLGDIRLYGQWDHGAYPWGQPQYGLPESYKQYCYGHVDSSKMPDRFHSSRINLSTCIRPEAYQYVTRREVECMASGGFVMCDRRNGIEEILADDYDIAFWSTLEELRSKCKYYLAHEDERKKIAENGRAKALELWEGKKTISKLLGAVGLG